MYVPVRDMITPWRNDEELSTVKRQLFTGRREGEPDEREEACKLVAVWRVRGHLPHAIDATASLTEAILIDERGSLSSVAMRHLYVGAFCRFVTGLLDDDKRLHRDARRGPRRQRLSMFERAKQLKLPASLVDLRHQATHDELPSMPALRQYVKQALDWIWNDFWRHQCPPNYTIRKITNAKDLRSEVEYYSKVAVTKEGPLVESALNEESAKACLKFVRLCKGNKVILNELAMIMIEWGFMVPDSSFSELGKPIDDTFFLWDPLIKKLCTHQQPFFKALTDQMSIQLALPSGPMDISLDRYREVITMWLEHLFATKQYVPIIKRAKYDINHILSTCVNCQNYWLVQLARRMIATPGNEATKKNYRVRVENAIPHLTAGPNPGTLLSTNMGEGDTGEGIVGKIKVNKEELYPGFWQPCNPKLWRPGIHEM